MPVTRTGRRPAGTEAAPADSKLERVYNGVKQRILDGTYSPGYRLVLDQLAREFEVSTLPVREAVRRLEAEGYVEFQRNVGARVARLDADEYTHAMHVLALLEGYTTAIAAPHLRRGDINKVRRVNQRMRDALGAFNPLAFTALNREFHFAIYERCPNLHVRTLVEAEWARLDAVRRSTFVFLPGRASGSVEEHDRLLDLIEAGADPREVEKAARDHKQGTADALIAGRSATSPPPGRRKG